MATTKKPSKTASAVAVVKREAAVKRDRVLIMADVCEELEKGLSLEQSCRVVSDARPTNILLWTEKYPELAEQYTHARLTGYRLLADRMMTIAAETHSMVTTHAQDPNGNYMFNTDGTPLLREVLVPLNSDVLASKRLQVDTLKWQLSKMLPKVYGDKSTTELTGPNGGAIQVANASLKSLSDSELATMQALLTKSIGTGGV